MPENEGRDRIKLSFIELNETFSEFFRLSALNVVPL